MNEQVFGLLGDYPLPPPGKTQPWLHIYIFNNILEYFDSFVRLTENLKLYTSIKLLNKTCQRTKEKSIKILSNGPIYN